MRNKLILMMQKPTRYGTTTFHPIVEWLSQISLHPFTPCHIPSINLGSHKTHQSKPSKASRGQTTSTHQIVILPHSWTSQNHHHIGLYPSFPGLQIFFSNSTSRTSDSSHNCYWALECLSNQGFQD